MNENGFGRCRGCQSPLRKPFLDLGRTPLANSYVVPGRAARDEVEFPLAVAFCGNCSLVQLTETVPPDQLFSQYLYFSSFSDSYLRHAREMADSLCGRFELDGSSFVVEIASNDGYLLQCFQSHGVPVLGIEPAVNIANQARDSGVPTLNRFFGGSLVLELVEHHGQADLIVGNNVFAHVPTTNDFLFSIYRCLKPDGWAVLEFPSLADLLANVEFDTIYHEHVFYFSLTAVEVLARRAGLALADVEHQAIHGGSLRVFLSKAPVEPSSAVKDLLRGEEEAGLLRSEVYEQFSERVQNVRAELRTLLTSLKTQGQSLAAYGAPAKGNTLLNYCGIGPELIQFTVDRSPHKQGHLLPGSRIPILAAEELANLRPDYALILPWNVAAEIIAQQRKYLDLGGNFIIPVPSPRIVRSVAELNEKLQVVS